MKFMLVILPVLLLGPIFYLIALNSELYEAFIAPRIASGPFGECHNWFNGGHVLTCSVAKVLEKNIDINQCSELEDVQGLPIHCVHAVAIARKDVGYCQELSKLTTIGSTVAVIDSCIEEYALYEKDSVACQKITDESDRTMCSRKVAQKVNYAQSGGPKDGDAFLTTPPPETIQDTLNPKMKHAKTCEAKATNIDRVACYSYAYTFPGDKFEEWIEKDNLFDLERLEKESAILDVSLWSDASEKFTEKLLQIQKTTDELGSGGFLLKSNTETGSGIYIPVRIDSRADFLSFKVFPIEINQEAWLTVYFDEKLLYTNYVKDLFIEASTYPEQPYAEVNVKMDSLKGKNGIVYIILNTVAEKSLESTNIRLTDFEFKKLTPLSE